MITVKVAKVSRTQSCVNRTQILEYDEKGRGHIKEEKMGAEWETVELTTNEESQPEFYVANVQGSAPFFANDARIIINDPKLFGTFKAGDIIHLDESDIISRYQKCVQKLLDLFDLYPLSDSNAHFYVERLEALIEKKLLVPCPLAGHSK